MDNVMNVLNRRTGAPQSGTNQAPNPYAGFQGMPIGGTPAGLPTMQLGSGQGFGMAAPARQMGGNAGQAPAAPWQGGMGGGGLSGPRPAMSHPQPYGAQMQPPPPPQAPPPPQSLGVPSQTMMGGGAAFNQQHAPLGAAQMQRTQNPGQPIYGAQGVHGKAWGTPYQGRTFGG